MVERKDKLQQHLSPQELAEYFHTRHPRVGKQYATHGDVWDCDANDRIIGLLHLILNELRTQDKADVALKIHQRWLNDELYGRQAVINLNLSISQELERIAKLLNCNVDDFPTNTDLSLPWVCSLGQSTLRYFYRLTYERDSFVKSFINEAREQLKRLETVKYANDIIKLRGIGKVRRDALIRK